MKKTYQITAPGKIELEEELAKLKGRRGDIADKIADARDYGDLSENAEYDSAREEQGIGEVWDMIQQFEQQQKANGYFNDRRKNQNVFTFQRLLQEQLRVNFFKKSGLANKVKIIEEQIVAGEISPYSAVAQLMM